jgi:integrase
MMSVRKKPNGKWFYRKWVKAPGWVRPVRIFGMPDEYGLSNTKAGCEEALRRKLRELIDGVKPSPAQPPISAVTVRSFKDSYLEHSANNNKPSTHETKDGQFDRHILPELGDAPLREIDFARLEDFKSALRKQRKVYLGDRWVTVRPLKAKSVNNVMSIVHDMLRIASKRGLVDSIPDVEWLKVDEQDFDFLTFAEADALYDAALHEGAWAAMVAVGLRCGLRQGELLGLQWSDVDLDNARLRVKRTVYRGKVGSPKGGRWREINLGDDVLGVLKAHKHNRCEWVFCSRESKRLTAGQCRKPLERIWKRAGLRRIGWHVLRHTFASHLAMRGAPLRYIQELLGHTTIQMTERYAHLMPGATRDVVKLLDTGLGTVRAPKKPIIFKSAKATRRRVGTVGIENTAPVFQVKDLGNPPQRSTR